MLLAPFTLTETIRSSPDAGPRRHVAHNTRVPAWLITWLLGGALALLLVPDFRGGALGGWSLSFWLVAAPVIDVMWLTRARWMARIGKVYTRSSTRRLHH